MQCWLAGRAVCWGLDTTGGRPMANAANGPIKFSRTALRGHDKPKCRVIIPPAQGGWSEPALYEWELTAESWTDEHPHSEYNFVIEGQLFVEAGGVTVEAQAATSFKFRPARWAGTGRPCMYACLRSMDPVKASLAGAWVTKS
jgi:hypothetical protein